MHTLDQAYIHTKYMDIWLVDSLKVCSGVCVCVSIPESGTRGRESRSFLSPLSDDGDGESWYSWYWELLD